MTRRATWLLAVRVLRGTGRSGAARVGIAVISIGLATWVLLLVAYVPVLSSHRNDAILARSIHVSDTSGPAPELFQARSVWGTLGDRQFTQLLFSEVGAEAPAPPGADALPRPGTALVSPALARLVRRRPAVLNRIGGRIVGTIGPAGLADPDELLAYRGVAPSGSAPVGYADQFGGVGDPTPGGAWTLVQLVLLVAAPVLGFVGVATRLASRSKTARWDALRSAGAGADTVRRVAGLEGVLLGLPGLLVGLGSFVVARPLLTEVGVGGLRWFAADVRLNHAVTFGVLVAGTLALRALAMRAALGHVPGSIHERDLDPRLVWLRYLPLAFGVSVLGAIVVLWLLGRIVNAPFVFLAGAIAAAAGVFLALGGIVRGSGAAVAHGARRLPWRLGGHRASYDSGSLVRILVGLSALVLVAYVAVGVLTAYRSAAGGDLPEVVARVDAQDLEPGQVDRLLDIPARSTLGISNGATSDGVPSSLVYLSCPDLARWLGRPLDGCAEGQVYRGRFAGEADPHGRGAVHRFPTASGGMLTVRTPARSLQLGGARLSEHLVDAIVVLGHPPMDRPVVGSVALLVDRADLDRVESAAERIDPRLTVDSEIDAVKLEDQQRSMAVTRFGALVGVLLALLSFTVTSVDLIIERRGSVATLLAVGMGRRALRTSQVAQVLLPLVAALVVTNLVGWLIAQAYLAVDGFSHGLTLAPLAAGIGVSVVSTLVAIVSAMLVSVPSNIVQHLRAE